MEFNAYQNQLSPYRTDITEACTVIQHITKLIERDAHSYGSVAQHLGELLQYMTELCTQLKLPLEIVAQLNLAYLSTERPMRVSTHTIKAVARIANNEISN